MKQRDVPLVNFKSFNQRFGIPTGYCCCVTNNGQSGVTEEVITQIYLFNRIQGKYLNSVTSINPFLVVFICMEVPGKHSLLYSMDQQRAWCNSCMTSFYYGSASLLAAYAQDTLVISMQAMVMLNLISNPSVAHIWMHMD